MNKQTDPQPNDTVEVNDQTTTATSSTAKPKATTSKRTSNTASTNTMIAGLALVIAIIGCAGVGYNYWQLKNQNALLAEQSAELADKLTNQQQNVEQALQQATNRTKQQQSLLNTQLTDTQTKLGIIEADSTKLKASQANITDQIAKISTDSSQTWMLFEAKQLLKQAFFRLRASDINGASKLLEDLNETIKQRGDLSQSASKVNQAIETALLKLQQTEQVDLANLYSQLAAIQTQLAELEVKRPVFEKASSNKSEAEQSRWDKLSNKLSSYVRVDFNANSKILPILTSQGIGQLKMTLDLAIEKAQWAALSGESAIYASELTRISQLLEQYFDTDSSQVSALINKINQLKTKTLIVEVPDITDTLQLVNSYLDQQIAVASPASAMKQATGGNN